MKTESTIQRDVHRRRGFQARSAVGTFLAVAVALLMVLATALPADAQARRTRPPENKGSSGSTSSASPPPSRPSSPPAARSGSSGGQKPTAVRGSSPRGDRRGPAVRTRPGVGSSPRVIENDRRDYRYRGHRPYRGYRSGYYPYRGYHSYGWSPYRYSWHLGFGYWGWYDWPYPYPYRHYPHTYYDYGYHGPYRVPFYASQVRDTMGALDLDLKPGDTKIYLDGHYIGTADNFDGWPQYLWLEQGDYHFVFYAEGRRTIAREYKILPSVVIDVEDRLERGESTPPEELFPVPTERRDERLAKNAEMRARAEAEARAEADWRRRSEEIRQRGGDWSEEDRGYETPEGEFGSLQLTVFPPDASVYLDGRFLGTAGELMRLSRGLTVDVGEHDLSIVRPGHEPEEIRFEVTPGEVVELDIQLARIIHQK